MYFKKLELFGFKSFADKTELNFGTGITAIVGPNGCGKSNVFDAIRWVLGEQSAKELRGSAMEDVIFNGTDQKPGLGFAEVSLTFSNESKMLPVAYDEVTVTRRLFRSGESEYLMNRTPVRLKDITEMFMGTGIGAEAYSLIQQGRVDLVVSARPDDRRLIFDEAAGITKYKAKRKEALSKLRETEHNLLRINDIIIEVKRQISSLERQASKARRYKEEYEKLKGLETRLARYELGRIAEEETQLRNHLSEWKAKETQLADQLKELREILGRDNRLLEECEAQINDVSSQDIKMDGQIDLNNRQIGFNEERIATIRENEKRLQEQKLQLKERCRIQQEKIEEVRIVLNSLEETIKKNQEILRDKRNELIGIISCIKQANAAIQGEEEKILDISSRQVQLKNALTETIKEVQGSLARKRRLEMEKAKVSNERQEVDQKFGDVCQRIGLAGAQMDDLKTQLEGQTRALQEMTERMDAICAMIDQLEKRRLFLISQKDFIEKLRVQYEDMPDPIVEGRLFSTQRPLAHQSGLIGKVKEVSSCDPAKSQAVGMSGPAEIFEIICEAKFIELDPLQISTQIEGITQEINGHTVQKNELSGQMAQQKNTIDQINRAVQQQEKNISVLESQKSDIATEAGKLTEEMDLVSAELEEVTELLGSLKKEEDSLTFQLDSSNQELTFCQRKIKDNQDLIMRQTHEREETTVAIAQLETELASDEDKKTDSLKNLQMFTESLDQSLEEIQRIESEFSTGGEKIVQYLKEIEDLKVKIEELKQQKQSLKEGLVQWEAKKQEVAARIETLQSQGAATTQETDLIRQKIHDLQLHEQELAFRGKEIKDRLIQSYKIDLDQPSATESPVEPAPQPAAAVSVQAPQQEELSLAQLQEEIQRLKKRCESFGSVNLVAIEEFDQLRERFEFLTKQQSDLLSSKEALHQTIQKINRRTRQMFMDTFTRVSEEFRIYFRMLFGGGQAELVLLDPENVLESGIEIIARPPGKKLQNISLLSGGEKSLTAIALIFAVFKVNPSPFCVLDEIDAALDESNVVRFSYLLKDFAKIAQFIVITHNKKTIANANVLYGITMQEKGVSKVVSVRLSDQAQAKPEEMVTAGV